MVKKQSAIYLPVSFHRSTFAGGNPRNSGRILHCLLPLFPILTCKGDGNVLVTLLCPKLVQTRLFEVLRRKGQKTELTDSQIIHAISPFLEPWG